MNRKQFLGNILKAALGMVILPSLPAIAKPKVIADLSTYDSCLAYIKSLLDGVEHFKYFMVVPSQGKNSIWVDNVFRKNGNIIWRMDRIEMPIEKLLKCSYPVNRSIPMNIARSMGHSVKVKDKLYPSVDDWYTEQSIKGGWTYTIPDYPLKANM